MAVEAAGGRREDECNAWVKDRTRQPGVGERERERESEAAVEANRLRRRSAPNNDSRPRSVAREPRSREHLSVSLSLCSRQDIYVSSRVHVRTRGTRERNGARDRVERVHRGLTRVRSPLERTTLLADSWSKERQVNENLGGSTSIVRTFRTIVRRSERHVGAYGESQLEGN